MATAKQQFEKLVGELEPAIEAAFLNAVANAATDIPFKRIVAAFGRGDIQAAVDLMDLGPAALGELYAALTSAYSTAGQAAARANPVYVRFDIGDPEIEGFIKTEVGGLIREISDETRENVRGVLTEAFANGDNPTTTTQRIVGKVNRATGKREGGIIGLTKKQTSWLNNARRELNDLDAGYFDREARDKRHDRKIRNAIKNDKPLTTTEIDGIVGNYSNKLLKKRAKDIALTETMTAINETKMASFRAAAKKQEINLEWVDKVWNSSGDGRVRHTHRVMDGQTVRFDAKFTSPSGATLNYPCDPKTSASERIRCRCWMQIKINIKRKFGVSDD